MADLAEIVSEIQAMHLKRETSCQTIPLEPRPFKPRRRPKTAIIAIAALRAQRKREANEALRKFLTMAIPERTDKETV